MGFRSYIRQFLGAILMLFRPSLPWWFAAGSGSIFGVAACHRSSRSRSSSRRSSRKQEEKVATIIFFYRFQKSSRSRSSSRRKQEEKVAKIHLFLWVSEVTLGSFWAQFWCFAVLPCHGDLLLGVVRQQQPQQQQQQPQPCATSAVLSTVHKLHV